MVYIKGGTKKEKNNLYSIPYSTHLSILPFLIALLAMTRIDDDVLPSTIIQTSIVSANLAAFAQHPVLVASLPVTRPHIDGLVVAVVVRRAVDTHRLGFAANL